METSGLRSHRLAMQAGAERQAILHHHLRRHPLHHVEEDQLLPIQVPEETEIGADDRNVLISGRINNV
jgi:hypothetical protein